MYLDMFLNGLFYIAALLAVLLRIGIADPFTLNYTVDHFGESFSSSSIEIPDNEVEMVHVIVNRCKLELLSAANCKYLFVEAIRLQFQRKLNVNVSKRQIMDLCTLFSDTFIMHNETKREPNEPNKISLDLLLKPAYNILYWTPGAISNSKLVLCISHFTEDLSWLKYVEKPFVVLSKSIELESTIYSRINRGNEVSAYLHFIVAYYHSLPELTLFLHGHDTDWHQLYTVPFIVAELDTHKKYHNVNNFHVNDRNVSTNRYMQQLRTIWPDLFQQELGEMPSTGFREKCCAQFAVHRDRIRLRSLQFYQRLLEYVLDDSQDDAAHVDGYHSSMSFVLEFVWHYIFGEPALLDYPGEHYMQLTDDIKVYL
jgi:hypothetical protein